MRDLASTIAGLWAAIEEGDQDVLPILADVYEEMDHPLASALRRACAYSPAAKQRWYYSPITYWWRSPKAPVFDGSESQIPQAAWDRLVRSLSQQRQQSAIVWGEVDFPTKAAAFLAIAEALMQEES